MFNSSYKSPKIAPSNLGVALQIGLRYITAKRNSGFVSFVSIFATLGMLLGTFALIVVLSVMNGFDVELKQRILRVVPHGFLSSNTAAGTINDWPELQKSISGSPRLLASAPFIGGQALASGRGVVRGLELQGVLPDQEKNISVVADYFVRGAFSNLQPGEYGIVMGSLLTRSLGLSLGERVSITLPEVSVSPAGIFPRSKRFILVGIFDVQSTVDETLAMIHLTDAQKLFRRGESVDGLHLKFDDIYHSSQGLSNLSSMLGEKYQAKDWSETQGSLFQAVKMEKTVTGILLAIIIAVAAFNIVTSLVMMVTEKRSDIAVLRTLGLTRFSIILIFVVQGFVMGVIGIGCGALLGIPCAIYIPKLMGWLEAVFGCQVFDPNVYFVSQLPSVWVPSDTVIVIVFALTTAFLATLYPAFRASKIEPAEALRYDV